MTEYEYWDPSTGEGIDDHILYARFNECLDELYGETKCAGFQFQTSRALQELDEIAYRCGFNDWLDSELRDGEWITEVEPNGREPRAERREERYR